MTPLDERPLLPIKWQADIRLTLAIWTRTESKTRSWPVWLKTEVYEWARGKSNEVRRLGLDQLLSKFRTNQTVSWPMTILKSKRLRLDASWCEIFNSDKLPTITNSWCYYNLYIRKINDKYSPTFSCAWIQILVIIHIQHSLFHRNATVFSMDQIA